VAPNSRANSSQFDLFSWFSILIHGRAAQSADANRWPLVLPFQRLGPQYMAFLKARIGGPTRFNDRPRTRAAARLERPPVIPTP
jgi:hypothetical protein